MTVKRINLNNKPLKDRLANLISQAVAKIFGSERFQAKASFVEKISSQIYLFLVANTKNVFSCCLEFHSYFFRFASRQRLPNKFSWEIKFVQDIFLATFQNNSFEQKPQKALSFQTQKLRSENFDNM